MNKIYFDVRIANFKGDPMRIFSQYDVHNQQLQVAKILPFYQIKNDNDLTPEQLAKRRELERHTLLVTDSPNLMPNFDIHFKSDEYLDYSARAYLEYAQQGVLHLPPEIKAQANVESILDFKKLDLDKGMVYHLDPSSTRNLHVCMLALCYACKKSSHQQKLLQSFDVEQIKQKEVNLGSMQPFTV